MGTTLLRLGTWLGRRSQHAAWLGRQWHKGGNVSPRPSYPFCSCHRLPSNAAWGNHLQNVASEFEHEHGRYWVVVLTLARFRCGSHDNAVDVANIGVWDLEVECFLGTLETSVADPCMFQELATFLAPLYVERE